MKIAYFWLRISITNDNRIQNQRLILDLSIHHNRKLIGLLDKRHEIDELVDARDLIRTSVLLELRADETGLFGDLLLHALHREVVHLGHSLLGRWPETRRVDEQVVERGAEHETVEVAQLGSTLVAANSTVLHHSRVCKRL